MATDDFAKPRAPSLNETDAEAQNLTLTFTFKTQPCTVVYNTSKTDRYKYPIRSNLYN